MALAWEGWGNQNPCGGGWLWACPIRLPQNAVLGCVGTADREERQREQAPSHCTLSGPGQAGIHELGTPSHGVQKDHRTSAGRRFPTPLHPCQLLLCQEPMACTKLPEVPPAMQEAAKHDFYAGFPALPLGSHLGLQLSLSGCAVSSQTPTTTSATTSPSTHQCYWERCLFLFLEGVVRGFFSVYVSMCL